MSKRVTAHYFAATSTAPLDAVCRHLQRAFSTEPFEFESHAHWEYARATSEGLAFNITRSSDGQTIEKWIEGTPRGVNYQAIIWCPDSESVGILARFRAELGATLGSSAEHFLSLRVSNSAEWPDELAPILDEPPSGFSLPFTWFIAVGLAAGTVLGIRSCSG